VRVIVNPAAAAGKALHLVGDIGEAMRRYDLTHEIVLTRERGHATELARAARGDGVDVIAVAGGDGTIGEVAQAYLGPDATPIKGPDLAVIPCGTGGDFRKTLGMSGALDEAVARIRHGARKPLDLGIVRLVGEGGIDIVRAFVNVASFGISGAVDTLVNAGPKWLGGRAAFFLGTLRAMATYRNAAVRVKVDGRIFFEGPAFNVAIANGRYFGGGMMIAPHADLGDGRFDIVAVGDLTRRETLGLSGKIYKGSHLAADGVRVTSGMSVDAEPVHAWASVLADIDGEQSGKLPLRADIAKGAITLRA
jgi:diacylglycerol kinase (ATP)